MIKFPSILLYPMKKGKPPCNLYEPKDFFKVIEIIRETEKGMHLLLKTDKGEEDIWVPKYLLRLDEYEENGKPIMEAAIPSWIIDRAGLA